MKIIIKLVVLTILWCGWAVFPASAQYAAPPSAQVYQPLSDQQLDQLLGPIALYPDPLIAQILPAATLPTQIVMADRYVTGGGDPNQIDQQPWDPSVQALARYPNVLKWMDDNLAWTTQLGLAFLNQQQEVMNSIQRLRESAQNMGNLVSTPQQQVVDDNGDIEILPADPQMIYVPEYAPDTVYYQTAGGAPFITFGLGFAIGGWLNGDFDWHNHHIVVWTHDHPRPPDWWHRPPDQRRVGLSHQTTVWHPDSRRGAVPVNQGDRGWGDRAPVHPVDNHPQPSRDVGHNEPVHPNEPPHNVTPPPHFNAPEPSQSPRPPQTIRPPASGSSAFIGIQSAHETQTFSQRGQQSRGIPAPAPVQHSSPAPSGGSHGGGGGDRRH